MNRSNIVSLSLNYESTQRYIQIQRQRIKMQGWISWIIYPQGLCYSAVYRGPPVNYSKDRSDFAIQKVSWIQLCTRSKRRSIIRTGQFLSIHGEREVAPISFTRLYDFRASLYFAWSIASACSGWSPALLTPCSCQAQPSRRGSCQAHTRKCTHAHIRTQSTRTQI